MKPVTEQPRRLSADDPRRRVTRLTIQGLVMPSTDDLEKRVAHLEQTVVAFLDVFRDLGVSFDGDEEGDHV